MDTCGISSTHHPDAQLFDSTPTVTGLIQVIQVSWLDGVVFSPFSHVWEHIWSSTWLVLDVFFPPNNAISRNFGWFYGTIHWAVGKDIHDINSPSKAPFSMSQGPDRLEVNQLKHHGKDFVVALCFFARRVKPMIKTYCLCLAVILWYSERYATNQWTRINMQIKAHMQFAENMAGLG